MRANLKNTIVAILIILFSGTTVAFAQNIIPKPQKAQMNGGSFTVNNKTRVVVADNNPLFMEIAQDFAQTINTSTGYSLQVEKCTHECSNTGCTDNHNGTNTIILKKCDGKMNKLE